MLSVQCMNWSLGTRYNCTDIYNGNDGSFDTVPGNGTVLLHLYDIYIKLLLCRTEYTCTPSTTTSTVDFDQL